MCPVAEAGLNSISNTADPEGQRCHIYGWDFVKFRLLLIGVNKVHRESPRGSEEDWLLEDFVTLSLWSELVVDTKSKAKLIFLALSFDSLKFLRRDLLGKVWLSWINWSSEVETEALNNVLVSSLILVTIKTDNPVSFAEVEVEVFTVGVILVLGDLCMT